MRFLTFTLYDIGQQELGQTYSAGMDVSNHWKRIMTNPNWAANRDVENIFEEVRLAEFSNLPSRKYCLFFFDLKLDPYKYAESISINPDERHLVEVEILDSSPKIARVNKSVVGRRIEFVGSEKRLNADREDMVADAREYWSGITQTTLDEEILFCGNYRYTQIIRPQKPCNRALLRKLNREQTDAI